MQGKLTEISDGVYGPRPHQVDALSWIDASWKDSKRMVLHAGVGSGKSLISRTIQRKYDSLIVTPANTLVHQYVDTYKPNLTAYIGQSNYVCEQNNTKCLSVKAKGWGCRGACPLERSRQAADNNGHIVTNYAYAWIQRKELAYTSRVLDEAHSLPSVIRSMTNTIKKWSPEDKRIFKQFNIDPLKLSADFQYSEFMKRKIDSLYDKLRSAPEESDEAAVQIFETEVVYNTFLTAPELFVRAVDKKGIAHYGVYLSRSVIDVLVGKGKSVLMSGTLLKHDLKEMLGDDYSEYRVPSVISADRRAIIYDVSNFPHSKDKMNYPELAENIMRVFKKTGLNGVCHVTYSMAKQLEPYLASQPGVFLYTDPEQKKEVLQDFMNKASSSKFGNFLIGAGITEGLDLKDDLARVNIIAKILYPNLGDPFVQKRSSLDDGAMWYAAEALKHFMQAVGRTTRGPQDRSVTVVLDPAVFRLISEARKFKLLDKDFIDSIYLTDGEKNRIWESL